MTVIEPKLPNPKEAVRVLDVRQALASLHWTPPKPAVHHSFSSARRAVSPGGKLGLAKITRISHLSTNFQTKLPAPQTLIQTQVHPELKPLARIPVPQAVVWTSGQILQEKIVTPAPKPLEDIEVKPSLAMPNKELTPAEVSLTSTPFVTKAPIPLPGTTAPVDISAAKPAQQLLETASKEVGQISPARVISVSDIKLQNGEAVLPVINEVAASEGAGSPTPEEPDVVAEGGLDNSDSRENGSGASQGAGNGSGSSNGAASADGSNAGNGGGANGVATVANSSNPGMNTGGPGFAVDTGYPATLSPALYAARHIQLPMSGQYGMVIVGASPQENYPETANLWTGRLVYTVYLQSETADNWILQYSLPKSPGDTPGDGIRPDAPWAFDMMRPNLGMSHGVVLVHGFVSPNGHFEKLSVPYPPGYAKTDLLLRALKRWVFRPAMSRGFPVTVEILLIIPGTAR
ncbi:MAG TPA: hypothetical protein VME86_13365 [Acidobacteriaceae bacterium]|nr:hypothetical protein [Acidobacteriaceae bacterium]